MVFHFKDSTFWPYYFKVWQRKKKFEHIVQNAKYAPSLEERVSRAISAANYAVYNATGFYASSDLENIFLEAALTIPDVICSPVPRTVLHVLTRVYSSGGHTRVVERWINLSMKEETHTIIILNQGKEPIPSWLSDAVENHGGKIIVLSESDVIKRAYLLRQMSANFERIILHVHMDDPTPIIAYGVASFKTPIILFNHADHLFWLGVSIADMVAELRYGSVTASGRSVQNFYVLGIPCLPHEDQSTSTSKGVFRKDLGIPEDAFVILTTGSEFKYRPIGCLNLCNQLIDVVLTKSNVICYAIGPTSQSEQWKHAYEKTGGRIIPLGLISDKKIYEKYLQSADLYIGSYPFPGYTALMDASQYDLPFLQLLVSCQQKHMLQLKPNDNQSQYLFYSPKLLVQRILNVIENDQSYTELCTTTKQCAEEYMNSNEWLKRLYDMYSKCPSVHFLHPFQKEKCIIDDDACLIGFLYEDTPFDYANAIARSIARNALNISARIKKM